MAQLKSTVVQGALTVTGNAVANKLIKMGGTSDQILMADGSTSNKSDLTALINAAVTIKGTLGTGGTITSLPTASASNLGFGYKVITDGTYNSVDAKIGDMFICYKSGTSSYVWMHIPSGDDIEDTWRPVQVDGTQILANGNTTGAINLKAGTNVSITNSSGTVTFAATDTGATSVEVTGSGNAVTAASYDSSTRKITLTKGTTFLTEHQSLADYVKGPSSSTDNAIARFNSTTGKLIQNSTATIDDNGNLSISGNLYVPENKYAYFGTTELASFRGNANGAFIVGAYSDIYLRGGLSSNDSSSSSKGVQLGASYLQPETTNHTTLGASGKVWKNVYATQYTSTVATGTAPLNVTSTTLNTNLNADMLDGKHASEFLTEHQSLANYVTLNGNQTITGIKTFSHSTFGAIVLKRDGSANASSVIFQNSNGTLGSIGMTGTVNGGLKRWTADTNTVYTIWDSGNDGSGSGLDADKLDGQEGSYYLNYNNFTNTPTIPTVNNGTLTIQKNGTNVATFTANQSGNTTANITVPDPANYYWANVKVASTSSTATTPSVQKIGITGSTATTAEAAVTMEYDSSYKALKFVFA